MGQQTHDRLAEPTPKSFRSGPTECRSVRDWLGYAKGQSDLAPQSDKTMANYDKALLSRQVARDLERIADFMAYLVFRGMTFERACQVTVDVLKERVRQRCGLALRTGPVAELHQVEEDAEGAVESAECAFVHDPESLAKATAFLDRDAAYMVARGPLVALARQRVARG